VFERPKNSRLDKGKLEKAGFELLPDLPKALEKYYAQLRC